MPALIRLDETYVDGSAWTPQDFNQVALASQRFQDWFTSHHDADGYHTRDGLIPIESALVGWDGVVYSIIQQTADGTLAVDNAGAPISTGLVRLTLAEMDTVDYWFTIDPVPSGTEVLYGHENRQAGYVKTTTSFEAVIYDNAGTLKNRDFLLHVFGTRTA